MYLESGIPGSRACHTSYTAPEYALSVLENNSPNDAVRLKALLKDAGLSSRRLDASSRLVMYKGRTRDWSFSLSVHDGWFHARTYVCEIPDASSLRADLLDIAMTANQSMSLVKFGKGPALYLEFEYRAEHIEFGALGNMLMHAVSSADQYYPKLFRVVSGDAVLDALDGESASAAIELQ